MNNLCQSIAEGRGSFIVANRKYLAHSSSVFQRNVGERGDGNNPCALSPSPIAFGQDQLKLIERTLASEVTAMEEMHVTVY